MRIVKNATGEVEFRSNAGVAYKVVPPTCIIDDKNGKLYLQFAESKNILTIDPAKVASTQVLPAAQVAFTGDSAALMVLLKTSFFTG